MTGSGAGATAAELIDLAAADGVMPGAVLAAGRHTSEPLLLYVAGDAQRDGAATRPMRARCERRRQMSARALVASR